MQNPEVTLPEGEPAVADFPEAGDEANPAPGAVGLIPVLLLDDDPAVSRVIQTCLVRNGYSVTMAPSGVDGIREIMQNDFAVILCDMMMPALSGDMFYRAVERIRPSLCSRIIFITGHRGDGKTREFIKSVNGQVLLKPFNPTDLLDAVGFAAVCGFFSDSPTIPLEPLIEPAKTGPAKASGARPASQLTPGELKQSPFWKKDRPTAESALESLEDKVARGAGALKYGLLGAAFLAFAAIPAGYYLDLKGKVKDSSTKLLNIQEQWGELSRRSPDLTKVWGNLQALQNVQKRLAEEQEKPRWTPALRVLANGTPPEIALRSVIASAPIEGATTYEIRITGICAANAPRAMADTFRANLEAKLKSLGADGVSAEFDRLEEVLDPQGQPDPRQVNFSLVIKTGPFAVEEPKTGIQL